MIVLTVEKHLPGKHDQSSHGRGGGKGHIPVEGLPNARLVGSQFAGQSIDTWEAREAIETELFEGVDSVDPGIGRKDYSLPTPRESVEMYKPFTETHDEWRRGASDLGQEVPLRIADNTKNQFGNRTVVEGTVRAPSHVFRGVSVEEYDQIVRTGQITSDMRGAISMSEGTNAGLSPSTAFSYLPKGAYGTTGRVIRIKVDEEDGWFGIRADDYARTRKPIPASRIDMVTPPIEHTKVQRPDRDYESYRTVNVMKHGSHDQSSHGRRGGRVGLSGDDGVIAPPRGMVTHSGAADGLTAARGPVRDENGHAVMLKPAEAKARYGTTAPEVEMYFAERGANVIVEPQAMNTRSGNLAATYGAIQAVDDLHASFGADLEARGIHTPEITIRESSPGSVATFGFSEPGKGQRISVGVHTVTILAAGDLPAHGINPPTDRAKIVAAGHSSAKANPQKLAYGVVAHEYGHYVDHNTKDRRGAGGAILAYESHRTSSKPGTRGRDNVAEHMAETFAAAFLTGDADAKSTMADVKGVVVKGAGCTGGFGPGSVAWAFASEADAVEKALPPIILTIEKHQAGKHDQSTHGRGGGKGLLPIIPGAGTKTPGEATELSMAGFDAKTQAAVAKVWSDQLDGDTLEDADRHLGQVLAVGLADPEIKAAGMRWYHDAHDESVGLAKKHDMSLEQTTGVIAALSPGGEWESNKVQADQLIGFAKKHPHMTPEELAFAARAEFKWSVAYGMGNYEKAALIAQGGAHPGDVLNGSKVRSFYNNINDPGGRQDVTIDTHMLNAAFGGTERKGASGVILDVKKPKGAPADWQPVQVEGADFKGRKSASSALIGTPKSAGRTIGVTPAIADSIRRHADAAGILPSQAQAIIWVAQKKLHPPVEAREATKKLVKLANDKYAG